MKRLLIIAVILYFIIFGLITISAKFMETELIKRQIKLIELTEKLAK